MSTLSPAFTLFWTIIAFHLDYPNSILTDFLQIITLYLSPLNTVTRLTLKKWESFPAIVSTLTKYKSQRTSYGQQAPTLIQLGLPLWFHLLLLFPGPKCSNTLPPVPFAAPPTCLALFLCLSFWTDYSPWSKSTFFFRFHTACSLIAFISLLKWPSIIGELSLITLHNISAHIPKATALQNSRE